MRGIPLLEILFIAVLFSAAAIPLAHLTAPKAHELPAATRSAPGEAALSYVELKFAHPPLTVVIGDTPIEAPNFDTEIAITSSTLLKVTWPEGTPTTAVTLTLEPEGLPSSEATFWATSGEPLEALVPTP